jgi:hypothetical protein
LAALGFLGGSYVALYATSRFGPWFYPGEVTPGVFRAWQAILLIVTLLIWPGVVVLLLSRWVPRTQLRYWGFRDLLVVEVGAAVLWMCASTADYWLYESVIDLGEHKLALISVVYAALGVLILVTSCVLAIAWAVIRLRFRGSDLPDGID